MSDRTRVRVRPLSGVEVWEGFEAGWTGRILNIQFVDDAPSPELDPGALVEVESDAKFYLGILQENRRSGISVLVEHMLDRNEIQEIQEVWG